MSRKLLICPFFGDLPSWWDEYEAQLPRLAAMGYDFLLDFDLPSFKRRATSVLGVDCPITFGSSKIHDYRPALGMLYAEETQGYEWWGHADFDVAWGRLDRFATDDKLDACDIWSDCSYDYVGGPFSVYRVGATEDLFMRHPAWRDVLETEASTGWMETFLSETLKENARVTIEMHHAYSNPGSLVRHDDFSLFHGDREISHFHANRTKEWPF